MFIPPSELILNPDNSIYHLNLQPGDVATTVITVGDSARIDLITRHFDTILLEKKHREFRTVTGEYNGKTISIIGTGIGTDNIDIVLNELDAIFNVDFETRSAKENKTSLNIIRLGTSGSIIKELPVDSILVSKYGIGIDGLIYSYNSEGIQEQDLLELIETKLGNSKLSIYAVESSSDLFNKFSTIGLSGITLTANGFYGPQSRSIRLKPKVDIRHLLSDVVYKNQQVTNLEMETSALYGLSKLLGHKAISINAILANRIDDTFSKNPQVAVEKLIEKSLDKIAELAE